jgi:hypothetical protein
VAWVVGMHIAMANVAAPWLVWYVMFCISKLRIACNAIGGTGLYRTPETKKPGTCARAIRFLACCLTWLQYAGK